MAIKSPLARRRRTAAAATAAAASARAGWARAPPVPLRHTLLAHQVAAGVYVRRGGHAVGDVAADLAPDQLIQAADSRVLVHQPLVVGVERRHRSLVRSEVFCVLVLHG